MKIVVLDACALHLGYLGCYGNDWVATPNLDRLASAGLVADWHFVETPQTTLATPASAISLMHELEQAGVGVRRLQLSELTFAHQVIADFDTLTESGDALLWVDVPSLAPPWKLASKLLDSYFEGDEEEDGGLEPWPDPPTGTAKWSDEDLLRSQNTYAAVVTYWDAQLGEVCEQLQARDPEVGIVVTARSGLPLGEHGLVGFAKPWLHEEVVHVPLVSRVPGLSAGRIDTLTQPPDLVGFLQALFKPDQAGSSPLLARRANGRAEVVCTWRLGDEEEWAARSRTWALICPRTGSRPVQLYAKPEDHWEV